MVPFDVAVEASVLFEGCRSESPTQGTTIRRIMMRKRLVGMQNCMMSLHCLVNEPFLARGANEERVFCGTESRHARPDLEGRSVEHGDS